MPISGKSKAFHVAFDVKALSSKSEGPLGLCLPSGAGLAFQRPYVLGKREQKPGLGEARKKGASRAPQTMIAFDRARFTWESLRRDFVAGPVLRPAWAKLVALRGPFITPLSSKRGQTIALSESEPISPPLH